MRKPVNAALFGDNEGLTRDFMSRSAYDRPHRAPSLAAACTPGQTARNIWLPLLQWWASKKPHFEGGNKPAGS